MEAKLYVGNLSFNTTDESIRTLFAQAGEVTSVDLIKDRFTGASRGFAFVVMASNEDAQKAISMFNGYKLDNRELRVSLARPREEGDRGGFTPRRTPGTGFGQGRGQGGPGGRDRRGGGGGQGRY